MKVKQNLAKVCAFIALTVTACSNSPIQPVQTKPALLGPIPTALINQTPTPNYPPSSPVIASLQPTPAQKLSNPVVLLADPTLEQTDMEKQPLPIKKKVSTSESIKPYAKQPLVADAPLWDTEMEKQEDSPEPEIIELPKQEKPFIPIIDVSRNVDYKPLIPEPPAHPTNETGNVSAKISIGPAIETPPEARDPEPPPCICPPPVVEKPQEITVIEPPKLQLPPNGTLIKLATSPDIFLIQDNLRQHIQGEAAGKSNDFNIDVHTVVSPEVLNVFSLGTPIYVRSNTVVHLVNTPHYYLIDGLTQRHIESPQAATDYGLNLNQAFLIQAYELAQYTTGTSIAPKPIVLNPILSITSSMNATVPVVVRGKGIFTQAGSAFPPNLSVKLIFQKPDGSLYPPKSIMTNSSGSFTNAWSPLADAMVGTYSWWVVYTADGHTKETNKQTYRVDS